jgi:hypothetical protein
MICTGETYKDHVKMAFTKGIFLEYPCSLFNTGAHAAVESALAWAAAVPSVDQLAKDLGVWCFSRDCAHNR